MALDEEEEPPIAFDGAEDDGAEVNDDWADAGCDVF